MSRLLQGEEKYAKEENHRERNKQEFTSTTAFRTSACSPAFQDNQTISISAFQQLTMYTKTHPTSIDCLGPFRRQIASPGMKSTLKACPSPWRSAQAIPI
jgi:hypothetical protein